MTDIIITNNGNSMSSKIKDGGYTYDRLKELKSEVNLTTEKRWLQTNMDISERHTLFHSIPATVSLFRTVLDLEDFFIRNYLWAIHSFLLQHDSYGIGYGETEVFAEMDRPSANFRVGACCPKCFRNIYSNDVDTMFSWITFAIAFEYFEDEGDPELFAEYWNPDSDYTHINQRYFGGTLPFGFDYECTRCGEKLYYETCQRSVKSLGIRRPRGIIEPLGLLNTKITDFDEECSMKDGVAFTFKNNQIPRNNKFRSNPNFYSRDMMGCYFL